MDKQLFALFSLLQQIMLLVLLVLLSAGKKMACQSWKSKIFVTYFYELLWQNVMSTEILISFDVFWFRVVHVDTYQKEHEVLFLKYPMWSVCSGKSMQQIFNLSIFPALHFGEN